MIYYCPNRNPHAKHFQLIAKPRTCQYCGQRIIYWKCSCGAKVHFDPLDEDKYGDHRLSCPETYGKNPYKESQLKKIRQIPEWNYEKEFLEILDEYKMVKNTNFKFHHLNNYYYCGTCANIRPVDTTVINRNNKLYFWCQCGNQKLLTIPYFGEFQLNYIHNKIRRCKEIILNYADSFYDEIPLLIYFGSYIVPLLNQEDIIDFMFINYVYRRNLDKIKSPPDYKYQVFLRQMVEL